MSDTVPGSAPDAQGDRRADEPPRAPDAADGRMAELLASGRPTGDLRKQVGDSTAPENEDLMARINALDFLNGVVGEATDAPERLGAFRITGLLGRGGMGTVYLAWQEGLEREVALKVLSPSWTSDPTMRERFRREARATAGLHHRHIVPIYDIGEAQGRLYFAMERVDGMSLDKHIAAAQRRQTQPLGPLDAARRFSGVADALGLAHRRRLLHRDVKPGNILVAEDGTLALTDFGLAKALDANSMRLTSKSGGFLGTLHYSSPEQAMGRDLTPASDLYSLGVTLFEAVTGELPLAGKSTENVLHQVLYGTPRRLRDSLPKVPRDLDAVVEKLLQREPGDRYQDGEELARDLQRIADGEPVHIRKLPLAVRIGRRVRKNPVLSGAILAAALLLVATFTLLSVLRKEKGQSKVSRHQNELVAAANAVRAEMGSPWGPSPILQCLVGGSAPPIAAPSPTTTATLRRLVAEAPDDEIAQRMLSGYESDPLPEAAELLSRGRGYEALRLFDLAIGRELEVRTFADLSVDVRLYRLYLGRACASLTASVMRPVDARRDLDLASFLRPGAAFPRALSAALEIAESDDPEPVIEGTERDLESASPERRAVVGRLLWAMAAVRPAGDANLMPFSMTWRARVRMHELAQRCIDVAPPRQLDAMAATGFGDELRELAVLALASVGDATFGGAGERLRSGTQRSVHPQSSLQGCLGAVQLLERPRATSPLVDATGQPMSPQLELASWRVVASLTPQRALLERLLPRLQRFVDENAQMPGIVPLAAGLLLAAGSDSAEAYVRSWIATDPTDPEALRCRLALALRSGDAAQSLDDAMAFVQRSGDRVAAIATVVRMCRETARTATGDARERADALGARFEGIAR